MSNKTFFNGALILIIFNLLGKVVGAVYRIPLAGILGGVGMGQYQLVFPLYCLILTVSTSGIPATISKLVAEYNTKKSFSNSKKLLWISVLILSSISILGFLVVVIFAKSIASFQGNPESYICYFGIAPAIIFVGVISAFRGYFQGNLKMLPTAISGLIEQIFKMVFGLILASYFSKFGVSYAVFGALIGISISELASFIFLFIYYIFYTRKNKIDKSIQTLSNKVLGKQLIKLSIPITLGGLISPITSMVDSFLVVNLLMLVGFSSVSATGLLGIQAGVVEPLINLPVVISISIGTALLPSISSLVAEKSDRVGELIKRSFQICLCISIAFAICFVIFGKQALTFLYRKSFTEYELNIATKLLFIGSINILFLSLVQVSANILQGLGRANRTVKSLLVGCIVKIIIEVCLVSIPSINIFGATISAGACYFIVFSLNYKEIKRLTGVNIWSVYKVVAIQECLVCLFAYFGNVLFELIFNETISLFIAGALAVSVFLVTYYIFFMYNKNSKTDENFSKNLESKPKV